MPKKNDSLLPGKVESSGLIGLKESSGLLSKTDFTVEFKKLLVMDCFNHGLNQEEFLEYFQSERIKDEARNFEKEFSRDIGDKTGSCNMISEILGMMDAGDFHGALAIIKKELNDNSADRRLHLLGVISSFKGKNPCILSSKETVNVIDSLFSLSLDKEYGAIAAVIQSIVIATSIKFNGTSFPAKDTGYRKYGNIREDHLIFLKYINVPEKIKKEALSSVCPSIQYEGIQAGGR